MAAAGAYAFVTPVPLLAIPVVGCLFIVSVVALGRLGGYTAVWLVTRVPFVARHKGVLGGGVWLLLFGGYAVLQIPSLPVHVSPAVLSALPIGGLVDLLAVGTAIGSSINRAVGGVVTATIAILMGGWLATAVADSLWSGDAVDGSDGDTVVRPTSSTQGMLARAISPLSIPIVSGSVKGVAEWAILRTRREPQRVNFLLIPVFMLISSQASTAIQSGGDLFGTLGVTTALAGGWFVGAAFGLNPLGDEGAVLPTTLLSASGHDFVRGLVVPSLLFQPVVVLLIVATGVIGGLGPVEIVMLSAISCGIAFVSAVFAPAIGMRFPRFSAIRIGNSEGVRPPRIVAAALHGSLTWILGGALIGLILMPELVRSVVAGIGYLPGFLLSLIAGDGTVGQLSALLVGAGEAIEAIPLLQFRVGLAVVLLVGGTLVTRVAYYSAIRRFERYEPH